MNVEPDLDHDIPAQLDMQQLLDSAAATAGLHDWGDDLRFKIGLEQLVSAVEKSEAADIIRGYAYNWIMQLLMTKLHLVDDARKHPDITAAPIEKPLVVIGLPRAGTTILYDLLSLDPNARSPKEWELFAPWPAPETATFDNDPRIAKLQGAYDKILNASPEMRDIYRLEPTMPGECNGIMLHHFASPNLSAILPIPTFNDWFANTTVPGQYESHKRILQQLQWKGPRGNWLLKSPVHLFDLEGLMHSYPDAQLVWTHRDPARTMSSISSHIYSLQKAQKAEVDKHEIGRDQWRNWRNALNVATRARAENPRVENAVFDISNRAIIDDPVAAVRSIYQHFGRDFSDEFAQRIEHFAKERGASRMGKHRHTLEEYGLDETTIKTGLSDYYRGFSPLF